MKYSAIRFIMTLVLVLIVAGSVGGYLIVRRADNADNAKTTLSDIAETDESDLTTQIVVVTTQTTQRDEEQTGRTTTKKPETNDGYAYSYAGIVPVIAEIDNEKWNLILVNRHYILPEDFSFELSLAAPSSGYSTRLDKRVAPYYEHMYNAAKEDGITLVPLSGYRKISTQKRNFENKISYYQQQGYSKAQSTQLAAQIILPPGTSEHNAGIAMDICSLDVSFENSKEFKWLKENAADYGFILRYPKDKQDITKITYEPWHWRYVGTTAAKEIKASGQCLEEYLGVLN